MQRSEIDYLNRRKMVTDSMRAWESAQAETQFLELLGSRSEEWTAEEFGWLPWVRSRPATRLILGQADSNSCFIFSPAEQSGYWAITSSGFRGQGVLSSGDIAALEKIAREKGLVAN